MARTPTRPHDAATSTSTQPLIDDCFRFDPRDGARLAHADVIARLKERIRPVVGTTACALDKAHGRVVAKDVAAALPVPGHTNSAVDGYAVAHAGLAADAATELIVAGRATAGHVWDGDTDDGEAIRIFTGAVMPAGCDSVAMQEDCETFDHDGTAYVRVPPGLKRGANVRCAGEDVQKGALMLRAGDIVRPQDIAAMASVGQAKLSCFERLRVAVVSTGDEVLRAGTAKLKVGQVYDTNAPMLASLAGLSGCAVTDLGIWPDNRADVIGRLAAATESHDVVLTSGGASLGDEDHMAQAITELGTRHFWQIAVKPGRPLMFGQINNTVVVGLPGNPVAVFVCFLMYVQPLLRRLAGAHWPTPQRFKLPAAFSVRDRKRGRREFWRATTIQTETGLAVAKYPKDGSGLISGLRAADGLIDVHEDLPAVQEGDLLDFIPFTEFGITA